MKDWYKDVHISSNSESTQMIFLTFGIILTVNLGDDNLTRPDFKPVR